MRLVVIGAVAAGTSAATKARRNDGTAEITIYESDQDISYSACSLPYYIGGEVDDLEVLKPRDAAYFKEKYDIDIKIQHEVVEIHPEHKTILVKNLSNGALFSDTYDQLIIATGAKAFIPEVEGIEMEHVFFLRNVQHAVAIKKFIEMKKPKKAVIAGSGSIGLEMLENLMLKNIAVTIVEKDDKITANLDPDMAAYLENILIDKGITIIKSQAVIKIEPLRVTLEDHRTLDADLVLMATGILPNTALAASIGIKLGESDGIIVDQQMKTNLDNISACGDCIETFSAITGRAYYRPLGTTANKTGRIAGDVITGGSLHYQGNLSTGIFKLFDLTIASTGLSEKEALDAGYDIEIAHSIKPDKPGYFNGDDMVIKAIADRASQRLLGVQIIGKSGVDKRIDVFATLLTYKATVDALFHLDLAYAPPYSTTKDPVHYIGMLLDKAINHGQKNAFNLSDDERFR